MARTSVIICQRRLTHYRVALFETMRHQLHARDIDLRLVHGQPDPSEVDKRDSGVIAWAEVVTNRYLHIGGRYLCWQPTPKDVGKAKLLILTQENSLLSNVPWLTYRHHAGPKVAFWGHGANLQSRKPDGRRERFKRWTTNRVDWWFAYTQASADLVVAAGFDPRRVTVLNNAIDTSELRELRAAVNDQDLADLRASLGFGLGPVGVFLGSLYPDKRLDFLFEAAQRIRSLVPDFQLLLIGDGPERDTVRGWQETCDWVHWVGARRGREKVLHAALGDVMLNPGLVGLGVLDAFSLGVPMVTTEWPYHSPEVSYLEHNVNGLVTADDVSLYAREVSGLLLDAPRMRTMGVRCTEAAGVYTIDGMAERFCNGILRALD